MCVCVFTTLCVWRPFRGCFVLHVAPHLCRQSHTALALQSALAFAIGTNADQRGSLIARARHAREHGSTVDALVHITKLKRLLGVVSRGQLQHGAEAPAALVVRSLAITARVRREEAELLWARGDRTAGLSMLQSVIDTVQLEPVVQLATSHGVDMAVTKGARVRYNMLVKQAAEARKTKKKKAPPPPPPMGLICRDDLVGAVDELGRAALLYADWKSTAGTHISKVMTLACRKHGLHTRTHTHTPSQAKANGVV